MQIFRSSILLIATALLAGCGRVIPDEKDFTLREEVRIADGQSLLIEKRIRLKRFPGDGPFSGPTWRGVDIVVSVVGSRLADGPPPWRWRDMENGRIRPLVLDRDPRTRRWFLIAHIVGGYAMFQVFDGVWKRVPLSPVYHGRLANIAVAEERRFVDRLIASPIGDPLRLSWREKQTQLIVSGE